MYRIIEGLLSLRYLALPLPLIDLKDTLMLRDAQRQESLTWRNCFYACRTGTWRI